MTGRQRLSAILNRRPADRLSWGTLIDAGSVTLWPEAAQRLHPFDFYRHIGADVYTFGSFSLPAEDRVPLPAAFVCPDLEESWEHTPDPGAGTQTHTRRGPRGTLTATFQAGHPIRYPVQTPRDLRALRELWEAADYVERDVTTAFEHVERVIDDDGIYLPTTEPSPVQRLIEYEMGLEGFCFLLADRHEEMLGLLAAMHLKRLKEYEIIARLSRAEGVIPVENTSSTLTSPAIYREHSLPQIRDYADVLHAHGKKLVLHMCGHLKALLPELKDTGADAFNAVTPPPVGTTYFEDVLDCMGEDFVIYGGILDPSVFHKLGVTRRDLHEHLDGLYTPRIRRANLFLWLGVDGLATPLERFFWVRDWMEQHGKLK